MTLSFALALLLAPAQSDAKEVKWLTKYADAVQQSKLTGKPLVIDAGREG